MQTKDAFIAFAIVAAFALLLVAAVLENIRVETIQQGGLPEISYPYSPTAVFVGVAAIDLLLSGIILAFADRGNRRSTLRVISPWALFSSSGLAILFMSFLSLGNYEDSLPRCLGSGGCSPVLEQHLQSLYDATAIIVVLGAIGLVVGLRLLFPSQVRKPSDAKLSEIPSP